MECEVCGAAGASKKARIDGTELVVCGGCSSLGEVTGEFSEKKPEKRKLKKRIEPKYGTSDEKVLVNGYGELIREHREDKGLTMKELGSKLGEKESVIRRLENEDLTPDDKLTKKLEKELDIELYVEYKSDYEDSGGEERKLTIGDVAKVK